jgi:hypothetical protein
MCGYSFGFGGCGGSSAVFYRNSCGGSGRRGFVHNICGGGSYSSDEEYECQKRLKKEKKIKIINANNNEEICDAINRLKK